MEVSLGDRPVGDGHPCYRHRGDRHQPQRRHPDRQEAHRRRRRSPAARRQVPEAHHRCRLHARGAGQAPREPVRRDQRRPQARARVRPGRVRADRRVLPDQADRVDASCWDEASVDFIDQFDPPCYKIASASLTDDALLRHTRAKGKPIILSTDEHARADRPRGRGARHGRPGPPALLQHLSRPSTRN